MKRLGHKLEMGMLCFDCNKMKRRDWLVYLFYPAYVIEKKQQQQLKTSNAFLQKNKNKSNMTCML